MEAEEAGVALWPQLPMRPSNQSQAYPASDSDSNNEPNTSQVQSQSRDHESRKILIAEKKRRKAERAALRLQKSAKKARKEARKSAASQVGMEKEAVLVPPSSAPGRPTLSFSEVSTSPVDDDEKEDDELDDDMDDHGKEEDNSTQSINTLEAPSVPTVESAGQTQSQDSASTQGSPSPNRPSLSKTLGREASCNGGGKPTTKDKESSPATTNTSGPSELDDSSIPEQADLGKAIKSIAPKRQNAEAGPSKKPKTKNPTGTPVTSKTSKKRTRESGVSQGKSPGVEDDDSLRRRLGTPSAVNEFIASRYWAPPYLNRLEAAGIITLKKGKLSLQETDAVKRHLEIFMRTNRLDEEQLTEIVMSKARSGGGDRESYPSFWQDIAIQIPGRPLRYVVKQIQRMYDPRARKGPWTAKEDADLKRAHEIHPGMWTKIAAIIDRTEQDCRDRYNKEILNSEKRNTGPWTLHEEDMLREAVKEANLVIGNTSLSLEAPWEIISAKMDHQRGPTQCRVKWHRELYPREKGTYVEPENTKLKPDQPKSLEAKRASQSQRKSPVVVLKKGKGNASQYKSQDIISDSGSEGEDEKEDA